VECCCSHQIDLNGCAGMNLASTTKHIMTILLMRYFLHQTYPCLASWTLQSEKIIVTTALSQLLIFCLFQFNLKRGGQRVATMLMYLSDGVEGGETFFPSVRTFSIIYL
jgi:hypothetical protein